MREIKFRAWDTQKNNWYKLPVWGECEASGDSENGYMTLKDNEFFKWSQYTGLKDKNGKEIYEGDIVYIKAFSPEKNIIRFNRGGFCLEPITGIESSFWSDIKYAEDERSEVIGNIYENPELLSGN